MFSVKKNIIKTTLLILAILVSTGCSRLVNQLSKDYIQLTPADVELLGIGDSVEFDLNPGVSLTSSNPDFAFVVDNKVVAIGQNTVVTIKSSSVFSREDESQAVIRIRPRVNPDENDRKDTVNTLFSVLNSDLADNRKRDLLDVLLTYYMDLNTPVRQTLASKLGSFSDQGKYSFISENQIGKIQEITLKLSHDRDKNVRVEMVAQLISFSKNKKDSLPFKTFIGLGLDESTDVRLEVVKLLPIAFENNREYSIELEVFKSLKRLSRDPDLSIQKATIKSVGRFLSQTVTKHDRLINLLKYFLSSENGTLSEEALKVIQYEYVAAKSIGATKVVESLNPLL